MGGPIRWSFIERDEVTSTQDEAAELASEGAAEGTVVVARTQSAGRGRTGRTWLSPTGGLYMSLVLRPRTVLRIQLLPLIASFAIVDGIRDATGLVSRIRWPNDIMLRNRKVSGVIAESSYSKGALLHAIIGVGINCNSRSGDLGELGAAATTLSGETGRPVKPGTIRDSVLTSFLPLYSRWQDEHDIINLRRPDISTIGKRVQLQMKGKGGTVSCIAEDVADDGALVVTRRGRRRAVHAEEIESLKELR